MSLNHYLIDNAEVQVVNQEGDLCICGGELLPEGEVDCPRCLVDYSQLLFGELVVVDLHCFGI